MLWPSRSCPHWFTSRFFVCVDLDLLPQISKILSNVVNNKYLEGRGSEVEELNSYIKKTNERFWKFLDQVTQVSDPIEQLQVSTNRYYNLCLYSDTNTTIDRSKVHWVHTDAKARYLHLAQRDFLNSQAAARTFGQTSAEQGRFLEKGYFELAW